MADLIKLKRGLKANAPELKIGEPFYCKDTGELLIGTETGNYFVGRQIPEIEKTGADPRSYEYETLGEKEVAIDFDSNKVYIGTPAGNLCLNDYPKIYITQADFKIKMNASTLEADTTYVINDYAPTEDYGPFKMAGNQFDIVIKTDTDGAPNLNDVRFAPHLGSSYSTMPGYASPVSLNPMSAWKGQVKFFDALSRYTVAFDGDPTLYNYYATYAATGDVINIGGTDYYKWAKSGGSYLPSYIYSLAEVPELGDPAYNSSGIPITSGTYGNLIFHRDKVLYFETIVVTMLEDANGNILPYDFKNLLWKGSSIYRFDDIAGVSYISADEYYYTFTYRPGMSPIYIYDGSNKQPSQYKNLQAPDYIVFRELTPVASSAFIFYAESLTTYEKVYFKKTQNRYGITVVKHGLNRVTFNGDVQKLFLSGGLSDCTFYSSVQEVEFNYVSASVFHGSLSGSVLKNVSSCSFHGSIASCDISYMNYCTARDNIRLCTLTAGATTTELLHLIFVTEIIGVDLRSISALLEQGFYLSKKFVYGLGAGILKWTWYDSLGVFHEEDNIV